MAQAVAEPVPEAAAGPVTIPPETFALPTSVNNTMLGVAFDQANGGEALSIQPGQLFGTTGGLKIPLFHSSSDNGY